MTSPKFIIVTRPEESGKALQKQLEKQGIPILLYPTIAVQKLPLTAAIKKQLTNLSSFDWIMFTSKNGITFFMNALQELAINQQMLQTKHIAAVGPKTAEELKKYHLPISFIPSKFTTNNLATELQNIDGKKILLPRADIATPTLAEQLEKKGATVINMPIYQTTFVQTATDEFVKLVTNNQILCITFTSPSTVKGFLQGIKNQQLRETVVSLPVVSIGPITTKAAKQFGFTTIYTADPHTTEGMATKIQESII